MITSPIISFHGRKVIELALIMERFLIFHAIGERAEKSLTEHLECLPSLGAD